ncbi:STAS domain-containing protein [Longispora sp. NPDC051575]|uniref:STAS domain-containing protein n=1 Tax=Longispora sp. NPDC051575 TaxID=3154943 RepID=UPI00341BE1EE
MRADIDEAVAARLRSCLNDLASAGHTRVVVDLQGAAVCDITGCDALLQVARRLRACGRQLHIAGAQPDIGRLLRSLGAVGAFAFHLTVDEAVLAVGASDPIG